VPFGNIKVVGEKVFKDNRRGAFMTHREFA